MGVSGPGFAHIIVDHLDQNPLNNTRGNLRLVGRRENAMNSGKCGWDRKTLSGFRGVSRSKASLKSPWFGWVMLPSGRRTSRSFATPEEAAKWRDIKIRETYGMATTVNREDWLPKHLRRKP
jgi:hypothetical protein